MLWRDKMALCFPPRHTGWPLTTSGSLGRVQRPVAGRRSVAAVR
ncbi:hypothetical protein I551_7721 [Mycobacterium ulcerans str. Harvey]|uniref:Uncharacterized protein n=1 Tax=Mycobacterium ulcerans str. Harvey TaxID=1299332 RepID=A0ABP3A2P2_MYCUL|nr:hypothetical protein I551_7721 [Mycobacterium ulcerans str. Harvey]